MSRLLKFLGPVFDEYVTSACNLCRMLASASSARVYVLLSLLKKSGQESP